VPVEAMACGTPVIAFNRGGVTETVVAPGGRQPATGLFFEEQTKDALIGAMEQFERTADTFDPAALRKQAKRFDAGRFTREFYAYLDGVLAKEKRQAA
jgi:glycosyltransferase involved in cell wall biosynthesis